MGFYGSVHDSRVLRSSPLFETLPNKCGQRFLLGDSGYPCLPNLLTPFKDLGNLTRRQRNYNLLLSKNSHIIEHCFGIMKQRIRQLYHLKLRSIRDATHFIRACAVLHNIVLEDIDDFDQDNIEYVIEPVEDGFNDDRNGAEKRLFVMNDLPLIL